MVPLLAKPPTRLAPVKIVSPIRKIFLRPNRSAARPPNNRNPAKVSAYALTIHCSWLGVMCRPCCIFGSATFTIEMSSTTMNCAAHAMASTAHDGHVGVRVRVVAAGGIGRGGGSRSCASFGVWRVRSILRPNLDRPPDISGPAAHARRERSR